MNIGIIGTGNMGRSLGLRWAHNGHNVFFGSRDPNKAKAIAANGPKSIQTGDFDAAAEFGEVVLYTVRDVLPSRLLRRPQMLAGKVVIDCNNRNLGDDRDPAGFRFDLPRPPVSLAEKLADDVPGARVVKAFNTMAHLVFEQERARLASQHISVFLCSDDSAAKAAVRGLAEELGFVGIDCGKLEAARLVEDLGDFIRLLIGRMQLGPFATISVNIMDKSQK